MTMNPAFILSLYILCGLGFYMWSEPYRPQSRAAFAACFRNHRGVWVVMVLIAACLWPLIMLNMAYRYIFLPKREDDDASR